MENYIEMFYSLLRTYVVIVRTSENLRQRKLAYDIHTCMYVGIPAYIRTNMGEFIPRRKVVGLGKRRGIVHYVGRVIRRDGSEIAGIAVR